MATTRFKIGKAYNGTAEELIIRLTAVLEGIRDRAKDLVRKDEHFLERSIDFEVDESVNNEIIGYVGTNVEYGIYQELGTHKMTAQPYLYPAMANYVNEIRKELGYE